MYCSNCGAEISPNDRFCTSCGADLSEQLENEGASSGQAQGATQTFGMQSQDASQAPYAPAQGVAQSPVPSPSQAPYQGKGQFKPKVSPAVVVGAVAAIAVVAVIVLVGTGAIPSPLNLFSSEGSGSVAAGSSASDTSGSTGTSDNASASTSANGSSSASGSSDSNGSSNTANSNNAADSTTSANSVTSIPTTHVGFKGITTATATSTLKTDKISSYGAEHVLDGDPVTAWAEGVSGMGIGESISLSGDGVQTFTGFKITNGFQKTEKIFYMNPRASEMEVQVDGTKVMEISLRTDNYGYAENFQLPQPTDGTTITFVIKNAVPGNKYEDTTISDISVY